MYVILEPLSVHILLISVILYDTHVPDPMASSEVFYGITYLDNAANSTLLTKRLMNRMRCLVCVVCLNTILTNKIKQYLLVFSAFDHFLFRRKLICSRGTVLTMITLYQIDQFTYTFLDNQQLVSNE